MRRFPNSVCFPTGVGDLSPTNFHVREKSQKNKVVLKNLPVRAVDGGEIDSASAP